MTIMKLLAIADRPPTDSVTDLVIRHNIDVIVTLGDLEYTQIVELKQITQVPKIGVYGNHCTPGYMEELGITDIHLQVVEIEGVTFGGFEGSHRYKKDPVVKMYTQEEASELLDNMPYVDVFIAHSPPAGINDEEDPAHQGFVALRQYVENQQPQYFLHGHTYPTAETLQTKYRATEVIYVTADRVVSIKTDDS